MQVQSAMEWQTESFNTESKLTGLLHAASLGLGSEQPLGNKSSSINTLLVFNSAYLETGTVYEFVSNSMVKTVFRLTNDRPIRILERKRIFITFLTK